MTALHSDLLSALRDHSDQIAVARPKNKDVSYSAFATMVARVQSVIHRNDFRVIGVLSTRSLEAYVTVLAAFFTGARFVPLNPELPVARLGKIIDHGRVDVVFHDQKTQAIAGALNSRVCDIQTCATDEAADAPGFPFIASDIAASDIAYQMFTSGSTGEPKGVPISYGNLAHYVSGIKSATGANVGGRYSQLFDLSFDLSMHDIFVALTSGGTLVPASNIDLMMAHSYIEKKKIDYWFSVPMVAAVALRGIGNNDVGHKLSKALFCGEQLPTDYAAGFRKFVKPEGQIFNLYGPTEATIAFTAKRFGGGDERSVVPLGLPFGESRIAIETDAGKVVEARDGVEGELLLGGPQVFEGYHPQNPAACFVGDNPRFYRSGDLVRIEDGEMHHLGRTDGQIKLRGYRIELGDIEAAFRKAFNGATAAAVVLGVRDAREIALAYEHADEIDDFANLVEHLPPYMIPARFLRVEKLPININGKVDRKSLGGLKWPA